MGMYDYLICKYPLPVEDAATLEFQTKDTPAQLLERYEIRSDGTLWHEDYDIEDQSDPDAPGILRFFGMLARVNPRWERETLTGVVRFYTDRDGEWLEFSARFEDGVLRNLTRCS